MQPLVEVKEVKGGVLRLSLLRCARLDRHIRWPTLLTDPRRLRCPRPPREALEHGHQLHAHLPLPESVNQGVDDGVGEAQQPKVILQHLRELASLTCHVHYAHHKEGAPEDQEADQEHHHQPQRLGLAAEAAPLQLLLLPLPRPLFRFSVLVLDCHPGSGKPVSDDLPLVGAGDLQDVQVDVDEDTEHREEADDEGDHGEPLDNGEKCAEAVVGVGLQLAHDHWGSEGERSRGTNIIVCRD